MKAYKVAFVGSHGVGKTTLCYGLAARLKASDVSLDVDELIFVVFTETPVHVSVFYRRMISLTQRFYPPSRGCVMRGRVPRLARGAARREAPIEDMRTSFSQLI